MASSTSFPARTETSTAVFSWRFDSSANRFGLRRAKLLPHFRIRVFMVEKSRKLYQRRHRNTLLISDLMTESLSNRQPLLFLNNYWNHDPAAPFAAWTNAGAGALSTSMSYAGIASSVATAPSALYRSALLNHLIAHRVPQVTLVPKMPLPSKDHRHVSLIRSGDHLRVPY